MRAGSASAIAVALLLSVGGPGQALAQQVNNLPVVQAVVKTATAANAPGTATVPAILMNSDDSVASEAGVLQRAAGRMR